MDAATMYNTVTLSTSLTALVISTLLAAHQIRTAGRSSHDANITHALLTLNGEYRSDAFRDSEDFVLNRLAAECSPKLGIADLPLEARRHVYRVGHFYADYGMLAALPTYDERRLLAVVHYRAREAWESLEPFLRAERKIRGNMYWSYFEHLALLASSANKLAILESQGIRPGLMLDRETKPPPFEERT